ncbi:hypothetical protein LEP1GSC046_3581 [Leptospira kirschneri serovar Bim str. 1051]|nr:hypothetical protein LEP1GSC042_3795 [Leptospira kirschneri serovar Bim str. PUO 1247]EMN04931.1 hypothetical protein LEP1GSC046_3581 [Leptospira kirschneri serovar Bim str. 1051]
MFFVTGFFLVFKNLFICCALVFEIDFFYFKKDQSLAFLHSA